MEYKKNISDIESKIRSITSKYKKKQEFKDISLEVLYNIKSYIESIISILQEFAGDDSRPGVRRDRRRCPQHGI